MPPRPVSTREDQTLHDSLRIAMLSGRVELKTDGLHLHKPGSPVYVAWDHLGPLLAMMLASLLVLLFLGLGWGIAAMTLVILAYIFGMRWWIAIQMQRRTLDAVLRNAHNLNLIWQYGGIALVRKGDPRPCVAPGGDWRGFSRRLGEPAPLEGDPGELFTMDRDINDQQRP